MPPTSATAVSAPVGTPSLVFHVGDRVVYPNQGVGVIENISRRASQQVPQDFYLLHFTGGNLRVMVPLANAAAVGLRPVSAAADIEAMLAFLAAGDAPPASPASNGDWKLRFKLNSGKLRSGSLFEVAEVLKTLLQLQLAKPLSFRERKMLDRATGLLAGELACAQALSFDAALDCLQRTLAQASLLLPAPEPS